MALRWYTVVVDCLDVKAQAAWWAEVLDYHPIFEGDDEVALVPRDVTRETATTTPWEQQKAGLVFVKVPEDKTIKNRLHIDLAPHTSQDRDAEIERLLAMGARKVDVGQSPDVGWDVFADPEGNEFCVLSAREF